ncbi:hypothetical protein [Algoriphagus pacificus]|uniref:Uncharacterized protein n=1 Tax=Algoriphagus pacificus TaxID=2811234 RepID=A0ABS3CBL3_9BACT|nr:hypothetical protein [Algoriphagus pacificus]MBN7814200.1 hypothetical protein [Algoriphagus pacificus]
MRPDFVRAGLDHGLGGFDSAQPDRLAIVNETLMVCGDTDHGERYENSGLW